MPAVWTRSQKQLLTASEGCAGVGCRSSANAALATCAYVDQWGWLCGEPCCSGHGLELSGDTYCHRHAGFYLALGGDWPELPCEFADPYRRRPSLVTWIPRSLDAAVKDLLTRVSRLARGDVTFSVTEAVRAGNTEAISWETRWEVVNTRPRLSVSFVLEGYGDPALVARIGETVVLREMPEWLPHHIRGGGIDAGTEAALRGELFDRLGAAITSAYGGAREVEIQLQGISFLMVAPRERDQTGGTTADM